MEKAAALILPLVLVAVGVLMLFGKSPYFDRFTEGAREGLATSVKLLPPLLALVVGVRMLSASGIPAMLSRLLAPALAGIGIPAELIPLLVVRPISGSASTASFDALLRQVGADSFPALCAAVIMGSSDTMIYVIGLYFSSVGIRKSRYAFFCATLVMIFGIILSCLICRLWFKQVN